MPSDAMGDMRLEGWLAFLTGLADGAVILPLTAAIALLLFGTGWWRGALAWSCVVLASLGLLVVLKLLLFVFGDSLRAQGLLSPSGHTTAATVVYGGLLALFLGRSLQARAAGLLGAAAIGAVLGATRIWLQVHTPWDIAVGLAVGLAGVAALGRFAGQRPVTAKPLHAMLVTLLTLVLLEGWTLHAEATLHRIADHVRLLQ